MCAQTQHTSQKEALPWLIDNADLSALSGRAASETRQEARAEYFALLARLATAEQERNELRQGAFGVALTENGVLRHKLTAAEARVEAAEAERRRLIADRDLFRIDCFTEHDARVAAEFRVGALREALRQIEAVPSKYGLRDTAALEAVRIARAALACPPQQRGEK